MELPEAIQVFVVVFLVSWALLLPFCLLIQPGNTHTAEPPPHHHHHPSPCQVNLKRGVFVEFIIISVYYVD